MFSLLDEELRAQAPAGRDQSFGRVLEVAAALLRAQPQMAPAANLASAVVASASQAAHSESPSKAARIAAEQFCRNARQAAIDVGLRASALIGDGATLLTHSRSSTVEGAMMAAWRAGRRFRVIATESRPMFEGRALARTLAGEGVEVTLIADSAAALVMDRVGMVLMGADCLTPGCLVNKIGSRMIALAARERGIRVFALCDRSKFINAVSPFEFGDEPSSADELWPDAPAGVRIINSYFEPTPLDYFTAIVAEDGLLAPDEASALARAATLGELLIRAAHI